MEINSPQQLLFEQIREEYGKVLYSQSIHAKESDCLKQIDNTTKWMAIVLSVLTTSGILDYFIRDAANSLLFSMITSLMTMILSSMMKSIDYKGRSIEHKKAADGLWLIREEYLSLLTDFSSTDLETIRKRRDDLIHRTATIYETAPTTGKRAYKRAQNAIKSGEQWFDDEEWHKLLPKSLQHDLKK